MFSSSSGPSSSRRPAAPRRGGNGQYVGRGKGGLSLGSRGEARRQSHNTIGNVSPLAGGAPSRGSRSSRGQVPGGSRSGGYGSVSGSRSRDGRQRLDRGGSSFGSSRGASRGGVPSAGPSRGSRSSSYPSSRQTGAGRRQPSGQRGYGSVSSRRTPNGTSSVRIGDLPRQQRGPAIALPSGLIKKVLVAVVVIALLGGIYAGLYFSGLFKVEHVTVTGSDHLTEAAVVDLADVPGNATMLTVNTDAIRQNVLANGWVQDVSVNKVLPSTLQLQVKERTIQAVVEVTSKDAEATELWGVSTDGYWLMKIPEKDSEEAALVSDKVFEDAESVLHVTDVPYGVIPEEGQACTDSNINNALSIIGGMTTELADQVKVVSADGAETTTLILDNGVEIAFGSADDIRDKERVCLELMKEHEGQIAYINVRTVNRPTWRAL